MAPPEDRELVPLRPGFDVVWHGFDRAQVKQYLEDLEEDIRLIASDRDAALSQVADLTEQLTAAHARESELGKQLADAAEPPKDTDDLNARCKRLVALARNQAAEITARAQAAATHSWAGTEDAAAKLRASYEKLLSELTNQHQQIREQHGMALEQARKQVAELTTGATQRRQELDAEAERRRLELEDEFERDLASKREALAKEIEHLRATSRAEAERRLRETAEQCRNRVAEATRQVQELQGLRRRVIEQLQAAQRLIRDSGPLLAPLSEERRGVPNQRMAQPPSVQPAKDGDADTTPPNVQRTISSG